MHPCTVTVHSLTSTSAADSKEFSFATTMMSSNVASACTWSLSVAPSKQLLTLPSCEGSPLLSLEPGGRGGGGAGAAQEGVWGCDVERGQKVEC